MSKIKTLYSLLFDSKCRFDSLASRGHYDRMPEAKYLKKLYKIKVGKELNLDNPQTFTEKIQWLKLYDRNPVYTKMQDKLIVREIIAQKIGEEYLIPLIGVWDHAEDIDFDQLPDQFVLKCNHDCASVVICRDKALLDIDATNKKLNRCLKTNYSKYGVEWAYRDIPHKIVAEKYMQNGNELTLTDYKFFCFNGEAKTVMLISGVAHTETRNRAMFDMEFNPLPVHKKNDQAIKVHFKKPEQFEQIKAFAEKIAEGIPFIRVDFYVINSHPYFGEVAFYPDGGLIPFAPDEWEKRMGDWIELPKTKSMQ